MSLFERYIRFNAVGALGMVVQLSMLALAQHVLGLDYRVATVTAVECSLLHNYVWHRRFTWREHPSEDVLKQIVAFHVSNGVVSLAGNLLLMTLLVGHMHWRVVPANLVSILCCSLVNFGLAQHVIFEPKGIRSLCG